MLATDAQPQWCRIARAVCLTNRRSLLGGEGQAACPGSAIEAADHSVLALAGGLEVVDVRLHKHSVTLQTQSNCCAPPIAPLDLVTPCPLGHLAQRPGTHIVFRSLTLFPHPFPTPFPSVPLCHIELRG
jgi:hypothetical protein